MTKLPRARAASTGREGATGSRTMLRWLFVLSIALIVYGSLYPFDFSRPQDIDWRAFFTPPQLRFSRPDMLGNVLLFVPLGLFATFSGRRFWLRAALVLVFGASLAVGLQLLQTYIPLRTAALADAAWNAIGLILGIAAGFFVRRRGPIAAPNTREAAWVRFGLLGLWLAAELLPFVPTLDWQTLKEGLKPLLLSPRIQLGPLLLHAAGILAAAEMAAGTLGVARTRAYVAAAALLVFLAKIFVVSLGLNLSALLGFILGATSWIILSHRSEWFRRNWAFWFLLGAITFATLLSGSPDASRSRVNWIPFAAMLQGSMLDNTRALAQSVFLIAALLLFGSVRDSRDWITAAGLALWLALLEAMEYFLGGHTSDITKPLLALLLVPVVRMARGEGRAHSSRIVAAKRDGQRPAATASSYRLIAAIAAAVILAQAAALKIILGLPQIPYNVRELFLDSGSLPRLIVFSTALLSLGAGSAWIASRLLKSRWPVLTTPVFVLVAGVTTLMLLKLSVTPESILDIAGSNNLYWFVINRDIWGAWGRELFLLLGSAAPVEFFERPVRFTALIAPVLLGIAVIAILVTSRFAPRRRAAIALSTLPWFWLSKGIAFDWSSTDNLNELIARNGAFGLGGGAYLYLLLFLICAQVIGIAYAVRSRRRAWLALPILALGVPIGWWLLNLGLEPNVQKYEQVFSGVQFLLGPDRAHALTRAELFTRWALLQTGLVTVLTAGYTLTSALLDTHARRRADAPGSRESALPDSRLPT